MRPYLYFLFIISSLFIAVLNLKLLVDELECKIDRDVCEIPMLRLLVVLLHARPCIYYFDVGTVVLYTRQSLSLLLKCAVGASMSLCFEICAFSVAS